MMVVAALAVMAAMLLWPARGEQARRRLEAMRRHETGASSGRARTGAGRRLRHDGGNRTGMGMPFVDDRTNLMRDGKQSGMEIRQEGETRLGSQGLTGMLAQAIAHVRSGGTPAQAFGIDGTRVTAARLSAVAQQWRSPEESRQMARNVAIGIAAACRLSEELGCATARCLQAVSEAYRRVRLAEARKQQAFAVPQATSGLLSVLPVGTVLLGELMGLRPLSFLFSDSRGFTCLALGGCCYAVGLLWNRALLRGMTENIAIRNRGTEGTPAEGEAVPWLTLIVSMLDVALKQGASIPHALAVVGQVSGGEIGRGMAQAGSALLRGSSWRDAWVVQRASESAGEAFALICEALEPSWAHGDMPSVRLEAAVERLDADERSAIEQAASRLSVRLLMPSGLCFLPAFVFVGIVPSIISFAI